MLSDTSSTYGQHSPTILKQILRQESIGRVSEVVRQGYPDTEAAQEILITGSLPGCRVGPVTERDVLTSPALRQSLESTSCGETSTKYCYVGLHDLHVLKPGAVQLRPGHGKCAHAASPMPGLWYQADFDPRTEGSHIQRYEPGSKFDHPEHPNTTPPPATASLRAMWPDIRALQPDKHAATSDGRPRGVVPVPAMYLPQPPFAYGL